MVSQYLRLVVTNVLDRVGVLGDATRRAIFELVAERPRPVGEIAAQLPVTRPAVSQHLKVLKEAGLVVDRVAGTKRIYQIDPVGLAELRAYFERFWNTTLAAFKDAVERPERGGSMTTETSDTKSHAVHRHAPSTRPIVVDAPAARAFEVFTSGLGTWWPPDHHILQAELAETVFEPRVGGHVIDRGVDGSECRWARVLAYEPPSRVVISWDINLAWQIEQDPARTSEVEVTFVEEEPGRTRVLLEHRHFDRHGEGWQQMRDEVGAPDGWNWVLQRFAAAAAI